MGHSEHIDRSIPFVDAHHHLWSLGRFRYEWLTEPLTDDQTAALGDYKMIRSSIGEPWRFFREFYGANVVKSVHVEANYADDPVEETEWLNGVSQELGFPNALVVSSEIETDDAEANLERHLEASNLTRGVRLRSNPDDPASARFLDGLRLLVRYGLSYELMPGPGGLSSARDLSVALPNLQIIVGHGGFPLERSTEYLQEWKRELAIAAQPDNVACKVSGLGMADHRWTIDSIRPWVVHCISVFGPNRIMFGTNWPVDILYATYLEQTDAYREIISGFTRTEQEAMLHGNAERLYGIRA